MFYPILKGVAHIGEEWPDAKRDLEELTTRVLDHRQLLIEGAERPAINNRVQDEFLQRWTWLFSSDGQKLPQEDWKKEVEVLFDLVGVYAKAAAPTGPKESKS